MDGPIQRTDKKEIAYHLQSSYHQAANYKCQFFIEQMAVGSIITKEIIDKQKNIDKETGEMKIIVWIC